MSVLVAKQVTKRFGGLHALSKIDLDVNENSIYSIIGPNGAGKTTFFNCVTGFYTPEEGEILLEGKNITGLSPDRVARRGISRTYQNIRLFKNMTSVENILIGMHPHLKSGLIGGILRNPSTVREEAEAFAPESVLSGLTVEELRDGVDRAAEVIEELPALKAPRRAVDRQWMRRRLSPGR